MAAKIEALAYWSRWKAAVLAAACLGLAIFPNLTEVGDGATITAWLFTPAGTPIRILSSLFMGFVGCVLICLAITANIWPLAVWIDGQELHWRTVTLRRMPLVMMKSVRLVQIGIIRIERTDGGKPIEIASSIMRSRSDVEKVMSALQAATTNLLTVR